MIANPILAAANLPREQSRTLLAAAYLDPAFHAFENAEIFHKEWISLCHVSQIPKPGDFVRVDLCGEPLLAVRGKDDAVRVSSRTCRHRGMDVMPSGFGHPDEGNKRVILCLYHLWSYDLGGKLIGAPEMQQAEGFDRSEVCLHEFRSEIWEGFVFVTFAADIPPAMPKAASATSRKPSGNSKNTSPRSSNALPLFGKYEEVKFTSYPAPCLLHWFRRCQETKPTRA